MSVFLRTDGKAQDGGSSCLPTLLPLDQGCLQVVGSCVRFENSSSLFVVGEMEDAEQAVKLLDEIQSSLSLAWNRPQVVLDVRPIMARIRGEVSKKQEQPLPALVDGQPVETVSDLAFEDRRGRKPRAYDGGTDRR